jgi:hypothetical protein
MLIHYVQFSSLNQSMLQINTVEKTQPLNKPSFVEQFQTVTKLLTNLICILDEPGSNLGPIDYPDPRLSLLPGALQDVSVLRIEAKHCSPCRCQNII